MYDYMTPSRHLVSSACDQADWDSSRRQPYCQTTSLNCNPRTSKQQLTPHLTSYTPPYAFTPFLNPPPTSTLQNTKTRSTPQLTTKQKAQPKTQSTYQHNTKSQHTNEIKTPSFPHILHPIPPPMLSPHFSTCLTNQPLNPSKHKAPPKIHKIIPKQSNPPNKYNHPKHNPKPKAPKQILPSTIL